VTDDQAESTDSDETPGTPGSAGAPAPEASAPSEEHEGRPLIERIGLAAIALGIGVMFGGVGYAAWLGGELFLAVIGGISCIMTLWVGGLTLIRG
jgi:hypothetical protein